MANRYDDGGGWYVPTPVNPGDRPWGGRENGGGGGGGGGTTGSGGGGGGGGPVTTMQDFINWWAKNKGKLMSYWEKKQQGWLNQIGDWSNKLPTNKFADTSYGADYASKKAQADELLARIQQGTTPEDIAAARAQAAQIMGMTPEEFDALQNQAANAQNAENVAQRTSDVANIYGDTEFAKEQQKAFRIAQQQATEQVQKQFEAVMAGEGGFQGFQAAYDLTSQLQNTAVKQQLDFATSLLDRASAAVQAENQYLVGVVQKGEASAADFVKYNFSRLSDAYTQTMDAAARVLSEWTDMTDEDTKIIQNYINALTDQMTMDLGGYTNAIDWVGALYESLSQVFQDAMAYEENQRSSIDKFFGWNAPKGTVEGNDLLSWLDQLVASGGA